MEFEWVDCFSPFALRKASWQSKLITLTSEESGSASNSSTLDLFSLSLFHRYDRSHFVDTLDISGNCYAIDRVSKHRGPVMSHPVAKSAELVDQRRFKMDAWFHLVSSLFSPTVNHDFVCCVLSMLQRYFASYFSQYFGKTNMLSIILTISDTQLRGMSWRVFRTFKTSGVQDFGSCGF